MADPAALLTVQEVASALRVSTKTVRRMCQRGELVTHRLGRLVRVDASLGVMRSVTAGLTPVADERQMTNDSTGGRAKLLRFDEERQQWVAQIDFREVLLTTDDKEEAERRLTALVANAPAPGTAPKPVESEASLTSSRWRVYFETGRGFAIKFWDSDGKRRTHRIPRDLPIPIQTMDQARRYAAAWYRRHVAAKGLGRRPSAVIDAAPGHNEWASPIAEKLGVTSDTTFEQLARLWTQGDIHRAARTACKDKRTAYDDIRRLERYVFPVIGHVPLSEFQGRRARELLQRVAGYADEISPQLADATRRQIHQLVRRVLGLAVAPFMILDVQPIQPGDVPRASNKKGKAFLYPDEDAKLLACPKVPLLERFFFGVLAREGMRVSEALNLTWSTIDLEHGTLTLDANKTDDPRSWALDPSVHRALVKWKAMLPEKAVEDGLVFANPTSGRALPHLKFAKRLRTYLKRAGVTRAQLFEASEQRIQLRAHDLRATFVTINLALGKSESWVTRRTGHKSSAMVRSYQREIDAYRELRLGPLKPLDEAIPELREA